MFQVLISDLLNFLVVVAGGPADTGPDTQPRAQDPDQGEGKPATEVEETQQGYNQCCGSMTFWG